MFIDPADLSATLGVFAEWENSQLTDAIETVIDACDQTDVPVGTLTVNPDDIEMRVEQGFDHLTMGKDTNHLSSANEETRQRYERAASKRIESSAAED